MFKKKNIIIIFVVSLLVIEAIILVNQYILSLRTRNCGPGGCPDITLKQTYIPQYKELTSYGNGSGGYECSKPIKMVSNTLNKDGQYVSFRPVDENEARVFCHMTYAIEYKGKLKVLQKTEVLEMISRYSYKDVSVKALEFKYIEDKAFVNRLLPQYANTEIGCIIVVETPNEKKVYLEDEELETFEQMDYKVFDNNLSKVSESDRKLFEENLK